VLSLYSDAAKVVSQALEKDRSGQPTVVFFNGRVLPAGEDSSVVSGGDLQLLRTIEAKKVSKTTKRLVADLDLAMEHSAVPQASFLRRSMLRFLLTAYKQALDSSSRRFDIGSLLQQRLFDLGLDLPTLLYHVTPPAVGGGAADDDEYLFSSYHDNLQLYVVVDPLSLAGQRAVAIIDLLVTRLRVTVNLLLTPRADITEFPLQNFYRFVLRQGSDLTASQPALSAQFTSLPRQHVLTVRMDTPEPWNVQATRAEQDPDNLRCTAQSCGDSSSTSSKKEHSALGYTLKSLLVAGQCLQSTEREASEGRFGLPPNGLQLVLTNHAPAETGGAALWDTLVMQNLGYFQLQATTPGWYRVQLAPGKSSQLYRIYPSSSSSSASGEQSSAEDMGLSTPVLGFGDQTHRLIVVKRRGMESYSLLDAPDDTMQQGQGLWNKLSSGLFGKQKSSSSSSSVVKHEDDDKIHVFSLASGHMYERLLRIMMLSVSRQASRPVKFWLLENYLSPAFKAMAAVMSARFGFEVAYVTYKWPHWLRHQTQQQRIIWGYKILFLDVLFPLHLKKVIYVDADQVVRADIAELWDMDLQGHAYAYTPFCASREETLGFQFWRQGYWKDHLQGRPYHISALYVVDLQRFRQQTVGDQLRATYDQLSRDPNSLANLDQDLPNYTQHAVPIFSLPQEWLWCETWCSEDSKSKAKTIDLCNNPLHKEPKLDMARRVISGKLFNHSWVELDSEIRDVATAAGLLHE
jgi:UDP-glucose:glycoprotein glucosyltransferase